MATETEIFIPENGSTIRILKLYLIITTSSVIISGHNDPPIQIEHLYFSDESEGIGYEIITKNPHIIQIKEGTKAVIYPPGSHFIIKK